MSLRDYWKKRDFNKTPEPRGDVARTPNHQYMMHKHDASHLHYDLRLELNGTLKSWAVPKGPCLDPGVKRLAVQVEDHPLSYGSFEGTIPKGEYGGGTVMIWDRGTWHCLDENPKSAYEKGHLHIELHADKLNGRWDLIRFKEDKNWFLIKGKDEFAKPLKDYDITYEQPDSALSQRSLSEIAMKKSASLFPQRISPQLATLVDKPPNTKQWLHEIKLDGYRMLAFKRNKTVKLLSRNGHDWTKSFAPIVAAIASLPVKQAIFDGEIVLLDKAGRSNFQLLQNAIQSDSEAPFQYYLFDCLYHEQHDLRKLPLIERKSMLSACLPQSSSTLHYCDHIVGNGIQAYEHACQLGLEGMISKQTDSPYMEGRTKTWLKVKCIKRQEFVIGGYSDPSGSRKHFGALYLGVYNDHAQLVYCGKVGTGFTDASLDGLYVLLKKNKTSKNPFALNGPEGISAHWVNPQLVAEIKFSGWTNNGLLRHASFQGLRSDKDAAMVNKENTISVKKTSDKKAVEITHPDKIVYPEDRITKAMLFQYYEDISSFMLPYITNRALTVLRCPEQYETCFYQRHPGGGKSAQTYISIHNEQDLLTLIQLGTLEIHPWNSTLDALETPDMLIFDLDPAPDVLWKELVSAAFEIRQQLEKYQLMSFVKTTGGKGLHIVVPINPNYSWEFIKQFTQVFATFMAQVNPDRYVSNIRKSKRVGKIYIDYLRNARTATAISPYSTRARIHAPIATPLHWDELSSDFKDTFFTLKTLPKRLKEQTVDPWETFWVTKQNLPINQIQT